MNKDIAVPKTELQSTAITPMHMLQMAVSQNADLDKLEKLMELQAKWEANEARKAFTVAMSAFKATGLIVGKDKSVAFAGTAYTHASLGNVCATIGAELSKHGLSFRWHTEQAAGKIRVTCTLTHIGGHSESVSLESSPDDSGKKNQIQQIASAVSYLERYTLLAITGTATQEQDDDGGKFSIEDIMDEGQLCDYIAAIESAPTQKEMLPAYLKAIEHASGLGDKDAALRISAAKDAALSKLSEKK